MMSKKTNPKNLTAEECRVLWKVAHKTGMDCWFAIVYDDFGNPCVYDFDAGDVIPMHSALADLWEGVSDPENYANCELTKEEDDILRNILWRLCGINARND